MFAKEKQPLNQGAHIHKKGVNTREHNSNKTKFVTGNTYAYILAPTVKLPFTGSSHVYSVCTIFMALHRPLVKGLPSLSQSLPQFLLAE